MLRLADPRLHWDRSPAMAEARARVGAANAPVVQLGYRYDSTAVIDAQPAIPSLEDITVDLDGAPGSRMPHRWVQHDGRRVSTLDLVGRNFTLFAGSDAVEWSPPGSDDPADVDIVTLDELADPDESARLGISPDGAILVRPDGFVAWRQQHAPTDPASALHHALRQILTMPA
jgi:putative polyketide hydroxylase